VCVGRGVDGPQHFLFHHVVIHDTFICLFPPVKLAMVFPLILMTAPVPPYQSQWTGVKVILYGLQIIIRGLMGMARPGKKDCWMTADSPPHAILIEPVISLY
jgi:hypothetical protein